MTMQGLHSVVAVCETIMQHLHSVVAVYETIMQGLHTLFIVYETTMQGLHGLFIVYEMIMQGLHSLFIVYEMIMQDLHSLFIVYEMIMWPPQKRRELPQLHHGDLRHASFGAGQPCACRGTSPPSRPTSRQPSSARVMWPMMWTPFSVSARS